MKRLVPKTPMILAALLAALALIAAGCGGSDDADEALTKEEFITQADEICAAGDEEITATANEEFGELKEEPPVSEQEAFLADVVAPNYEDQLAQIRELNPPEEDAEQVDELLGALEDLIAQLRDEPTAVLEATEPPEASTLAQDYGLQNCGS